MKKKPTATDTPQTLPPPPEIVVVPRQPLQRQQSILHNLAESRRENVITSSITRSISGANPSFYRSESSCFLNHVPSTDSYRFSINTSMNTLLSRHRLDILRSSNTSFYRSMNDPENKLLLSRLNSSNGIRMMNNKSIQLRQQQKERFYQEMKNKEKEAAKITGEDPLLLTYLLKKANHVNIKKENGIMIVTDDDIPLKKEDSKKEEKEDFLYGMFLTDSQLYIPSMETGSSLLLYLYQGTIIVQSKTIQQRDYSVINASLSKVDLFLGGKETQMKPWISVKGLNTVNTRLYKRIIQDFSLSLQTRSKNGFLPTREKTINPSFRRDELVNRVTVSIGAFSIRMTSEEFYRFLNVIQYTLLVNPTNSSRILSKENQDSNKSTKPTSIELLETIENKVISLMNQNDNEMIPVLRIKYTLEEVEWSLLNTNQTEIAVATLKGLIGEHTFCYDNKSENKITLNDLRIINPSYSLKEQAWSAPDVILDPVPLDRDKDDQSNLLEIIAVMSNQYTYDGITVNMFEHVGINVYPGCQYYILFQLTGEVATGIFRYFFPDDDNTDPTSLYDQPEEEIIEEGYETPQQEKISPVSDNSSSEIRFEGFESSTDSFMDDNSIMPIKDRKSTQSEISTVTSATTTTTTTTRFWNKKYNSNCQHEFDLVDMPGNCVVCKRKIGTARYLAYRCNQCGIMVDKGCMMKLLGKKSKKKDNNPKRLIFFEHFRIGTVEMTISTKGMSPLNLNNFNITFQHQIYSNKLTEWNKIFRQVKKAYTSELLRSAPSFVLRGWGSNNGVRSKKVKDEQSTEMEEENEKLSDESKISLLLGI